MRAASKATKQGQHRPVSKLSDQNLAFLSTQVLFVMVAGAPLQELYPNTAAQEAEERADALSQAARHASCTALRC